MEPVLNLNKNWFQPYPQTSPPKTESKSFYLLLSLESLHLLPCKPAMQNNVIRIYKLLQLKKGGCNRNVVHHCFINFIYRN